MEYRIIITDKDYTPLAELEQYLSFEAKPVFNDLGTWTLQMDSSMVKSSYLSLENRIILRRGSLDIFSGIPTFFKIKDTGKSSLYTLTGVGGLLLLRERIVMPEPATTAPPYGTDEYYNLTGVASTVILDLVDNQAGASARTGRQNLTIMATDPLIGSSIEYNGRWTNLLDDVKIQAAKDDLGIEVVSGVFNVYQPEDKTTSIVFSKNLQNVKELIYTIKRPPANFIFSADTTEGLSKQLIERQDGTSVINFGNIEEFLSTNPGTAIEQDEIATARLTVTASPISLKVEPTEDSGILYQQDYKLGDKVRGKVESTIVDQIVRGVVIKLTPKDSYVLPILGTPDTVKNQGFSALLTKNNQVNNRLLIIEGK